MEMLFGSLPEFFRDEAELRRLWSDPVTRKALLAGLADKGFGQEQLAEMQRIIDAERSDLFDVLAHIAYALPPLTRDQRVEKAKVVIPLEFNSRQQAFLDFVLSHYAEVGVEELALVMGGSMEIGAIPADLDASGLLRLWWKSNRTVCCF